MNGVRDFLDFLILLTEWVHEAGTARSSPLEAERRVERFAGAAMDVEGVGQGIADGRASACVATSYAGMILFPGSRPSHASTQARSGAEQFSLFFACKAIRGSFK